MDVPRILDAISSPADLKVLDNEELAILAREIRQEIVATTSVTGGHVASSLGAVDIIVALESLLDMPRDRVVFDVGHQAYAHKLLTGRREAFKTLRTYGGLSGFTKPSESPYDVHPSGHASDSLSIATGLAKARQLKGTDEKVVALIGDASLAGGMAFEALNYMGNEQLPLVVILNDNEMSISRNVGALMKHLGNIRANSHYREAREGLQAAMEQGGPAARGLLGFGKNMKESLKQMVIPHTMIYESLGIVCTAPIDGHNIAALRDVLLKTTRSLSAVLHGTSSDFVERTKEYIFEHIGQDLSLEDIAEHFYLSPSHFSRTFKAQAGETLIRFISRCKMEYAAQLLSNTNLKIYDVCEQVGYKSLRHFNKLFKAYTGMQPSGYRQRMHMGGAGNDQ